MSVIGPRPLLVKYLPYYTEEERVRHCVRPGLSGLAQVNGRNAMIHMLIDIFALLSYNKEAAVQLIKAFAR